MGGKFILLARRALDQLAPGDDSRRSLEAQLPAMRDSLVNACRDSAWDAGIRSCMFDAVDHLAFERCESSLTAAQRERLERGDGE